MILTALMIATFCAFGQKGIDSVLVPSRWLKEGMKDLIRFDACKEETRLLKESNLSLRALSDKNAEFAAEQQERVNEMRLRWVECNKQTDLINNAQLNVISGLNKALKKQKNKSTWNTITGVGAGVALGILVGILTR